MNLNGLLTTTTVEFVVGLEADTITINGEVESGDALAKLLDRIRKLAKIKERAKIVSENNFPIGTGLSSSASGFAALTVAGAKAAGLELSEKELSILARQGSGSACRSIPDGFVEWLDGDTSETSYAYSIFPHTYWDIVDIVVVLTTKQKDVSTTQGQILANSSPFFPVRLAGVGEKIRRIKEAMDRKDFKTFGEITEGEALELHAIMLTSHPSLIYWYPATISVMKAVKKWRAEGLEVYFTVNTGQNIHIICQQRDVEKVSQLVGRLGEVKEIIVNKPAPGTRIIKQHLF
jgi:diphosphomevalonate decarboxylase